MVYPVATVDIKGITEGGSILHGTPELQFDLKNLYPWSETWARIYKGSFDQSNENGTFIQPVYVAYWNQDPGADPLSTTIILSDWSDLILEDGQYTIEVLTQTPFLNGAPEVVGKVTFLVDREVEINGQIYSSD